MPAARPRRPGSAGRSPARQTRRAGPRAMPSAWRGPESPRQASPRQSRCGPRLRRRGGRRRPAAGGWPRRRVRSVWGSESPPAAAAALPAAPPSGRPTWCSESCDPQRSGARRPCTAAPTHPAGGGRPPSARLPSPSTRPRARRRPPLRVVVWWWWWPWPWPWWRWSCPSVHPSRRGARRPSARRPRWAPASRRRRRGPARPAARERPGG
mmetsp:Transcript_16340/g.42423  ORF Transcript_16340/g.42423 Transcript_16340/m.42423 type:complete len:210 (-) Transcript_16340:595-1224(-)